MTYNPDNVFAKILNGSMPCNKVYEDDIEKFIKKANKYF